MAMEVKLKMPDLSTTEGTDIAIIKWLVAVGDQVERGQVILEVETDKAVQEIEAIASGVLTAQLARPGDKIPVGQVIATIMVSK
jgi:pyruvate/2-oxoglutarate dehydrogenase complex dihydrolipoamide acyltransferase (E2) component